MDFEQASQVHFEWKMKLRNYLVRPDGSLQPSQVGLDNHCTLGKWLQAENKKHASDSSFSELCKVHSNFHRAATELVRRADAGEKVDAEAALGAASPFNQLSQRVMLLIMEMKRKVAAPVAH